MFKTAPEYSFSREADHLQRSVMRELLRHAVAPGMISLAGGLPARELLPAAEYADCLSAVLTRDGGAAMQYGPPWGPLREWIAGFMRGRGVDCTAEQVFITNGNQQGLTILSRLFMDPGDTAVIEAATFTGIQQVTAGRGAVVRTVETDLQTGADMDALEQAFARRPRPKLAVLIPDFHNPLGVSLSAEKRQRAAELAASYRVPLVEDDPYSLLRFAGEMLPPIRAHDNTGSVFYLGSFSKMLAPGLRLGWMIVPEELQSRITTLRESIDLETSVLTQRAVAEFLARGLLEPHLERLNNTNRERCAALLAALGEHFSDVGHWTQPEGGLFVWLTLPKNLDTWQMLQQAIEQHVVYIPGAAFTMDNSKRNTMRLNFSSVTPEQIAEGVARLAGVVRQHL